MMSKKKDKKRVLPERLLLTYNGEITKAVKIDHIRYDSHSGEIVLVGYIDVDKDMCRDRRYYGSQMVELNTLDIVDGDTNKIIRSMDNEHDGEIAEPEDRLVLEFKLLVTGFDD